MPQPSQTAEGKKSGGAAKAAPLLAAAGVLALALLAGALLVAPPSPYARYLSPPLPGGTRYTFLYRRHPLRRVREGTLNYAARMVQSVRITSSRYVSDAPTVAERSYQLVTTLLRLPDRGRAGDITVVVGAASPGDDGRVRDLRRETSAPPGQGVSQDLYVVDARSGMRIRVYHENAPFPRDAAVLSRTFRVLAPGEEPPRTETPDRE